jgi:hypothetical protein
VGLFARFTNFRHTKWPSTSAKHNSQHAKYTKNDELDPVHKSREKLPECYIVQTMDMNFMEGEFSFSTHHHKSDHTKFPFLSTYALLLHTTNTEYTTHLLEASNESLVVRECTYYIVNRSSTQKSQITRIIHAKRHSYTFSKPMIHPPPV